MSGQARKNRPMKILDWLLVALVAFAILLPFFAAEKLQQWDAALNGIAIFCCLLMLVWMWLGDGARSPVWNWLPPFWPWGRILSGAISRWGLVLMLIAGTVCGILAEKFSK
jgi:hypothetical protein